MKKKVQNMMIEVFGDPNMNTKKKKLMALIINLKNK